MCFFPEVRCNVGGFGAFFSAKSQMALAYLVHHLGTIQSDQLQNQPLLYTFIKFQVQSAVSLAGPDQIILQAFSIPTPGLGSHIWRGLDADEKCET